jgi:hypothetical protein
MPELKETEGTLSQASVIKVGPAELSVNINPVNESPAPANVTVSSAPVLNSAPSPIVAKDAPVSSATKDGPVSNALQTISGVTSPPAEAKIPDIYAMPKEFQHHNKVAGGNSPLVGALVILGSLVFLIVVGGGFFMYIFNPGLLSSITGQFIGGTTIPTPPEQPTTLVATNTAPNITEATTTSEVALPTETPQIVYFKYLKELSAINTFEDYYILVSKYGNGRKISAVESERLLAESTPETDKSSVKAIKEAAPKITSANEAGAIKEDIVGQTALLYITLSGAKATGTIAFTLENNIWKIGDENWPQTKTEPEAIQYTVGEDRDGDGLLDKEEDLLGSNKDSTDSDSDGYADLSETLNLYNPAGKNKLVDNTSIKSYLAEDQSFYLLYPSKWVRTFNSKDGSVVFRSSDDHFIQLMIENNNKNESLDNYFKTTLNLTKIKDSWRRTNDTWQGIMTEDGLQIYMMGTKKDKIYILRYSPSDTVLEYPNIFQMMIKSFVIKK